MTLDYDIVKMLQEHKELVKVCVGIPRTWGGKLEEYYETIWAKWNKITEIALTAPINSPEYIRAKKDFILYQNILEAFRKTHPELKIWIEVNLSNLN